MDVSTVISEARGPENGTFCPFDRRHIGFGPGAPKMVLLASRGPKNGPQPGIGSPEGGGGGGTLDFGLKWPFLRFLALFDRPSYRKKGGVFRKKRPFGPKSTFWAPEAHFGLPGPILGFWAHFELWGPFLGPRGDFWRRGAPKMVPEAVFMILEII